MPAAASFFEHQQLARRNTRVMVVLFLLAVVAVVFAVDLVVATVYIWSLNSDFTLPAGTKPGVLVVYRHVPSALYLGGAALTAGVILVVSAVNVVKLAGGGSAVAEMIGARRVAPGTRDPLERRLLNVVEEMALAAGTSVPTVYVLESEDVINAFAAGLTLDHAVIGVTRGALDVLDRDDGEVDRRDHPGDRQGEQDDQPPRAAASVLLALEEVHRAARRATR